MKIKSTLFLLLLWITAGMVMAQDPSLERLNASPRHHEWVTVKHEGRKVEAFLVFPEVAEKATAVVVIHENRGLTDWVRSVADQLASAGYLAIAPDLLSGMGPEGGKTSDFADTDAARNALYQLDPQQVTADLHAVADYVKALPAANGKVVVGGFCWGGSQTFRMATTYAGLEAAFVFYGGAPDAEALAHITTPVYGFYAGNDARINQGIPATDSTMKALEKVYDPVIYEESGHGFMRAGEAADASEANKKAHDEAWQRWLELLKNL